MTYYQTTTCSEERMRRNNAAPRHRILQGTIGEVMKDLERVPNQKIKKFESIASFLYSEGSCFTKSFEYRGKRYIDGAECIEDAINILNTDGAKFGYMVW